MTSIGKSINAARIRKKMSQNELGTHMGYKGPDPGVSISRFETGTREPRFGTLRRIAEALGVELSLLVKSTREGYANKALAAGRPHKKQAI